jgi:diadenosine tetraphosphate (Ap4A) HIT family hydrolase
MAVDVFSFYGGSVTSPTTTLCDRSDGGHLIVYPPRAVWERSELTPLELTHWSYLVAATGRAMLDVLPQLRGGCVNYWEAGNWSLHERAAPPGPKVVEDHRRVHHHIFGRSRDASDRDWKWGEAPKFPDFAHKKVWAQRFTPLNADERSAVTVRIVELLEVYYGLQNVMG